jgi:hypothetical protein
MQSILFITAFPPNRKSGGQVFTLNLLKDLSKKYNVDLVYFNYKSHSPEPDLPVNSIKSFDIKHFDWLQHITIYPLFSRRFNRQVLAYLKNISPKYDMLFFDFSQVAFYAVHIEHPYKILRSHDIIYQKISRKYKIFNFWVENTERKILASVKKIFVLSKKDAKIVKQVYNLDACATHEYINDFQFYEYREQANNFIFFGLWSRKENLEGLMWFIKKVYPLIDLNDKTKFTIIGSGLSEKIKKNIAFNSHFEYAGFVDKPLDVIYQSRALIAPLFSGAGVKVKVIDTYTTGTPVIGTDITFEGLPNIDGLQYLAKTPQEYADFINSFSGISHVQKQKNAAVFKRIYDNYHLSDML